MGLHVANALREKGHDVYVLDRVPYLVDRNSGVIHAGIFYPSGSLRERLCIEGNRLTFEWANKLGVNYLTCGKLVIPEPGQENDLEPFFERVRALPITTPRLCKPHEIANLKPALRKTRAIFFPSTGLIDAAGYVKVLARYLENQGIVSAQPTLAITHKSFPL